MAITIKNKADIEKLRLGGKLLAKILNELEKEVVVGATSLDVDDRAMDLLEEYNLEPMILGYQPNFAPRPYPAATCISVNEVVVHGIPNEQPITFKNGDVVSIDLVIGYENLVLDSCRTVVCGRGSKEAYELIEVTKSALEAGIDAARAGNHVSDIGRAVEKMVPKGYSIVEELCGHGVGYSLHEEPQIPNYVAKNIPDPILKPGMVLAIEPMLIRGKKAIIFDQKDGYTVSAKDGNISAHMEHTVLVTEGEPEILTKGD